MGLDSNECRLECFIALLKGNSIETVYKYSDSTCTLNCHLYSLSDGTYPHIVAISGEIDFSIITRFTSKWGGVMEVKNRHKRYLKMQYPDECRPIITINGHSRPIIILVREALVVSTKGVSKRSMGAVVKGVLTYPNGEKDDVHGYIIFIKGKTVVVKLLESISLHRINEQQLWIRQNYPDFDMSMN